MPDRLDVLKKALEDAGLKATVQHPDEYDSLGGRVIKYPRLADLIALKMFGGSRRDKADVVELLVKNPDADIEQIRSTCKQYAYDEIDELIAEAAEGRARR